MKTTEEWLQAFNLLYNNIASDKAPGLEPYEISYFLTAAQEAVVVALYNGTLGESFESTEEVTSYLSPLVKQAELTPETNVNGKPTLSPHSVLFKTKDDILFRTVEYCMLTDTCHKQPVQVAVIPVTQDEYFRTINNPFKRPNSRRVLRLSYTDEATAYTELIRDGGNDTTILSYNVRYVSKPKPILLENLQAGLQINGETKRSTCLLPETLHNTILAKAVEMAKATWNG